MQLRSKVHLTTSSGTTHPSIEQSHDGTALKAVEEERPVCASRTYNHSIRLQMRMMAKAFRGQDRALIRALLAEAQFDPELAIALRERWTMPRRRMAIACFQQGIRDGFLRTDANPDAIIDILYTPLYYRLQMGTGPLSDTYIDEIFGHAMGGLEQT